MLLIPVPIVPACCEMSPAAEGDGGILFVEFLRKMVGCVFGTCLVRRGVSSKRAKFLAAVVKARWPGPLSTVYKSLFLFFPLIGAFENRGFHCGTGKR